MNTPSDEQLVAYLDGELDGEYRDKLDSASIGVSHQLTQDLSLRGGYSYSQSDDQSQQGVSVSLALDW